MTPRLASAGILRGRPVLGLGLALGSACLALGVRLLLGDRFPPGFPFLTFFPAIVLTSFLAGARAGAVCALASLIAAWYFLIPPAFTFELGPGALMALVFFVAVAAVDIALIAAMQRALDQLRVEQALTARLYDQQRNLFEELQHRVANNMAFIVGLLRLQKRRITGDPASAAGAFDEAVTRIDTMGRIHRRLYDLAAANAELQAHLQAMCDELLQATGNGRITCRVTVPALDLPLDKLLPLSLLVAEVVTNSLKHGFFGRTSGLITVTLEQTPSGDRVLVIRDDGSGLPDGHDAAASTGLGMRIVQGLAAQIGGSIAMASDRGTVTRVTVPA